MAGEYLITAANGMHALLRTNPTPQPRQLVAAALIGCDALGKLAADGSFHHRLRTLAAHQHMIAPMEGSPSYTSALLGELPAAQSQTSFGAFGTTASATADSPAVAKQNDEVAALMEFLRKEEELLLSCGMRPEVIGELLEPIRINKSNFDHAIVDPEGIKTAVAQLHDVACKAAHSLDGRRPSLGFLGRVKNALGGGALILVNVSSWAVSMGFSLPLTGLSGAIGVVTILKAAVEEG